MMWYKCKYHCVKQELALSKAHTLLPVDPCTHTSIRTYAQQVYGRTNCIPNMVLTSKDLTRAKTPRGQKQQKVEKRERNR